MTQQEGFSSGFPALADEVVIYRALLRQSWIDQDTGRVKRDAYYLRYDRNEPGLSVNIASACSPQDCAARFRTCYGVATLKVADVRSLGLEVIQDSPAHANILGLPFREVDRLSADRFARLLAGVSEVIWLP